MRLTLIEIVQGILDDLGEDQVNTITGSYKSERVAGIVKREYAQLMSERNWPHLRQITAFSPYGTAKPTHLLITEGTKKVIKIFYNTRTVSATKDNYEEIDRLEPDEFLYRINQRNSSASNIQTVNDNTNVKLLIQNDKAPQYWTSFDDETIVFDSYDIEVDTTIQESKQQITVYVEEQTFLIEDDFIPDLPSESFPLLYNRCLIAASTRMKQETDPVAARNVQKGEVWLSQNAGRTDTTVRFFRTGRVPYTGVRRRNPLLRKD